MPKATKPADKQENLTPTESELKAAEEAKAKEEAEAKAKAEAEAEEKAKAEAEKKAKEKAAKQIKYVKMVRDPELYDAPHEAQVHPDEVDNYRPGGWEEA